ncbi:MAG: DUF1573 domain-containing protein [Ferruginibacter sp.]
MKKIFILSALSICTAFVYAQDHDHAAHATVAASDASKTPEVLILKQTEHDFGKIPQGKPVTTVFEVTNTGKTALKLDNVQASCGCTTPVWDKENDIAPGATSKITVGYNAAAEGPFTKFITITYNGNESKQVTIKGEVWKTPAESAPASAASEIKN